MSQESAKFTKGRSPHEADNSPEVPAITRVLPPVCYGIALAKACTGQSACMPGPTRMRSPLGGWAGWGPDGPYAGKEDATHMPQHLPRRISAQADIAPLGDPGAGHAPQDGGRTARGDAAGERKRPVRVCCQVPVALIRHLAGARSAHRGRCLYPIADHDKRSASWTAHPSDPGVTP
jgi:hypothetical protein